MGGRQAAAAARASHGSIPRAFNRYWEPFLGSGAVFFDLHARGLLAGQRCTLTDNNPDLIACYRAVRDCPEQVIGELSRLATRPRTRWRAALLRGPQRTIQSAARRARRRRPTASSHYDARAGGDVHLSQSHRLQRIVPAEQRRRVQRAGRPLCQAAHLRRGESPPRRRRRSPRPGVTLDRARFDRVVDECRGPAIFCISIRRTRR